MNNSVVPVGGLGMERGEGEYGGINGDGWRLELGW